MYLPLVPILPSAGVRVVLSTYTRRLPLPEQVAVSVPLVMFLVSPVTTSTYLPFGIFENEALPLIVMRAYESVVESV